MLDPTVYVLDIFIGIPVSDAWPSVTLHTQSQHIHHPKKSKERAEFDLKH